MQANDLVLVTGATGFIGGRLVEKLIREHGVRVRVLTSQFSHCSRPARFAVELVPGNLNDPASLARACAGCTVVFHAGYTFNDPRRGAANCNVTGSVALVDAARAAGVARFVHFSSVAVYGETADGELTETTPARSDGGDTYAETKTAVEQAVVARARVAGLPLVVLQPTIVYGPYAGAWVEFPLQQLKHHRVVLPRAGEGICNAVYVDDVCEAAILAARAPEAAGERFLISGPSPITWGEFFETYARMLGLSDAVVRWETAAVHEELRLRADKKSPPVALVAAVWRRPAARARLQRVAPVRWAWRVVPAPVKRWLHRKLDSPFARPPEPGKPLLLPSPAALPLYHARTVVKTDLARARLGYTPRFDFARGAELTRQWAEWARLLAKPDGSA